MSKQGIYLENCNGNHYETVVCVHQSESQSCYGYCQESRSACSAGYNLRRHSARVAECKKENNTDISSNYLKWKESIRAKRLYQDNVLRRQKVKDIRVEKYKMNLLYRVKLKRLSVEKYKIFVAWGESEAIDDREIPQ